MTERNETLVAVDLQTTRAYRVKDSDREAVWVGPGKALVPAWVAQSWQASADKKRLEAGIDAPSDSRSQLAWAGRSLDALAGDFNGAIGSCRTKEQADAVLAPVIEHVDFIGRLASEIGVEADRLRAMANLSPISLMAADELQRYAAMRPLIQEQIAGITLNTFADRLTAIATHGSESERRIWLEFVGTRSESEQEDLGPLVKDIEASLATTPTGKKLAAAAELERVLRTELQDLRNRAAAVLGAAQRRAIATAAAQHAEAQQFFEDVRAGSAQSTPRPGRVRATMPA